MPVHDWTRADDGLFHHFHNMWLGYMVDALNGGVLPAGYFAMTDQRADIFIPDIVTLTPASQAPAAGVAVAEPRTDVRLVARRTPRAVSRRRVLVRSARRVVAVIELVSRSDKDRPDSVGRFARKAADFVTAGVNVAVLDVLPPGSHDPAGMHAAVWAALSDPDNPTPPAEPPPADRPLTFAGYDAMLRPVAYLNFAAVGEPLPTVPLFLEGGAFVDLPLDETYMTGYTRLPADLRTVLG